MSKKLLSKLQYTDIYNNINNDIDWHIIIIQVLWSHVGHKILDFYLRFWQAIFFLIKFKCTE